LLFDEDSKTVQSEKIAQTIKDKGLHTELAAIFISPSAVEAADSASKDALELKKSEILELITSEQDALKEGKCRF
jgi:hypothetical protein